MAQQGAKSNESPNSELLFNAPPRLLLATNLGQMTDSAILQQSLSLKSVISTTSSFGRLFQTARTRPDLQQLNQIGASLQGAVFEQAGKPLALKKNKSLETKSYHQTSISINRKVHVPKAFNFISRKENDAFWDEILPKAPQAYRIRGNLVIMERILPLPKFHCLTRVYLGKSNGTIDNNTNNNLLRNFPLYLEPMEQIGIETVPLANAIGKTYATLHWGAAINGGDVEFVLGTSATEAQGEDYRPEFQHRAIKLYLLDFGQCEAVDLTQDSDVVYQAFKGAMVIGDNQRFIPHYSRSLALFATFRQGYIEAGNIILSDKKLNNKFNIEDFMQEYEEYAEDFV